MSGLLELRASAAALLHKRNGRFAQGFRTPAFCRRAGLGGGRRWRGFWVMSAIAGKKRRSRISAGEAGARLVIDELLRRGFDGRLAKGLTKKYDVLVGPPIPVHMRTVHVGPWYVRSRHFGGAGTNQVTVYVLIGLEKNPNCARFFVTKNSDIKTALRQPPDGRYFGFVDIDAVEQYEDNWDLLNN